MVTEALLLIDQQHFAQLRIKQLNGVTGVGNFRLSFGLEFQFLAAPPVQYTASHVHLSGDLYTQRGDGSGGPRYVGRLILGGAGLVVLPGRYPVTLYETLNVELDRRQLEALDEIRQGTGLLFRFDLHMLLMCTPLVLQLPLQQLDFQVNQSSWLSLLEQIGFRRVMLFELPVPDASSSPQLATAVDHLSKAQQAYGRGEYREAVGACRDVLESLSEALRDKDAVSKEDFENLRDKDKAARLRLLRRALIVLTHPARHADEVSAAIEWQRIDAFSILSMVAALVQEIGSA